MTFDPRLNVVDLTALQARITQLDMQKANASTVGGLATRLNAAETHIGEKAPLATVTALSSTVATKADVAVVNALSSTVAAKADTAAVTALSSTVASKADATAVATALGTKADVSALAAKADVSALALKADATALANKADVSQLATKADSSAVTSALATKADASTVSSLSSTVAGKADTAALAAVAATVPALATNAPPAAAQNSVVGAAVVAAREDHTHKLRFKRVPLVTNASGQVSVVWTEPFGSTPVMNDPSIMDAAGGRYTCTCLANSAAGCTYQISKARTLPAVLTLLSQLLGYDTWQPAPAGLTVYVSGAEATQ